MNNLKEIKEELESYIQEQLEKHLTLVWDTSKKISLKFVPVSKYYEIIIKSNVVYKSKDLELALKEYWKITGEEYE